VCIYTGEKSGIHLDQLLRLLDKYPHKVEVKGGATQIINRLFVITTNVRIEEWYDVDIWLRHKGTECIYRRIDGIFNFVGFTDALYYGAPVPIQVPPIWQNLFLADQLLDNIVAPLGKHYFFF
jgi:hypothetical protein